jgi:hypothetical protein
MVSVMRATCFVAALFVFPDLVAADEKCPVARPQVEVEMVAQTAAVPYPKQYTFDLV